MIDLLPALTTTAKYQMNRERMGYISLIPRGCVIQVVVEAVVVVVVVVARVQ